METMLDRLAKADHRALHTVANYMSYGAIALFLLALGCMLRG